MTKAPPFDTTKLDRLMEEAGIDLLLVTSKHNVQYLLGGHRAQFFAYIDAMGISRYLPVLVYPRDRPDQAGYIGHRTEGNQLEANPVWIKHVQASTEGSVDAIEKAVAFIQQQGLQAGRIGAEFAFLPFDAAQKLQAMQPAAKLADALHVLERLRMRKRPDELEKLRLATERVAQAMGVTFAATRPGMTKRDLLQILRREEAARDLTFEYLLITAGSSLNRAPSDDVIQPGDIISLDSGGNYEGYLGDICRMAIVGEPDAELEEMLDSIEAIQRSAIEAARPGALGRALYAGPDALLGKSRWREHMHFVAHGVGLVTHEGPHLADRGPASYRDEDGPCPLEAGMVVSVETTLRHPKRGFVKLEDTVAVTDSGPVVYGDILRGWNRAGQKTPASLAA
ncbi:MAG: aminopeptidase P family protein [Acetobacteraceae bacterium]|nr:aminopeptidase P family protein [Acetobacteraceae bacterium]